MSPVYKSVPGAVLGIVGSVFALIGALGLAMCAELVDAATAGATSYTWAAYVFGIGSAVVGLIGAIMNMKNIKIGIALMVIAVGLCVAICIMMYFTWAMIVALILLGLAIIISFAVKKEVD